MWLSRLLQIGNPSNPCLLLPCIAFAVSLMAHAVQPASWKLVCGRQQAGKSTLTAQLRYREGVQVFGFDLFDSPNVTEKGCVADKPFFVSVAEPDGDYRVTILLGNGQQDAVTTVKAEARRLMIEQLATSQGQFLERSFVVHVRTPKISGEDSVRLKAREIGNLDWDEKLTLEFVGEHPGFRALQIEPVHVPTVYIAGDSTVVDQDNEPWAAWGQMLPLFFGDTIGIANEAESGETIASFASERRFDKIFSTIRKGDYLMMQFAHNDQKAGRGFVPILEYQTLLRRYISIARSHDAHPVLVTSRAP